MKSEFINLKVEVVSPVGIIHYAIVKPNFLRTEYEKIEELIESNKCTFEHIINPIQHTLIVHEPNFSAQAIIDFNNSYFPLLGITAANLVLPVVVLPQHIFWTYFTATEIEFVKYMFSNFSNTELERIFTTSEASITRNVRTVLEIVNLKYPNCKLKNRIQFKEFGIKLGVHNEQRCTKCNQIL